MTAQARGWGAPPVSRSKIVTVAAGGVRLAVHRDIADLVALLCDETAGRGYPLDVKADDWGYAPRKIAGSNAWSNHAWGLAVDLNATANPMGSRLVTDMPAWMPRLWESYRFRWGGRYQDRPDAMHYEYLGTPSQAKNDTDRARRELSGSQEEDDMLREGAKANDRSDTREVQQAINSLARRRGWEKWTPLEPDGDYGPLMADAAGRAKDELGYAGGGKTVTAFVAGKLFAAVGDDRQQAGHRRQHERLATLETARTGFEDRLDRLEGIHPGGLHVGQTPDDPPGGFGIPEGEWRQALVLVPTSETS